MRRIFFLLFMVTFAYSCTETKSEIELVDEELIINYIAQHQIDAYHYSEGLYYSINDEYTGTDFPTQLSEISVKYKGYLLSGTVIDSSNNEFVKIHLNDCIEGWQMGIPLFSKGSKGKIFIPSKLAYGEYSLPNIPANSVIIYDIEVKDFTE